MEPIAILKEAQKAVPAVKFALGVAGIAAAVALVVGVIKDVKVAIFGTIIMLGLMFILLVFSSIARKATSKVTQGFAYILAGFFVLMIMGTTFFLFTSAFFAYPRPINQLFSGSIIIEGPTPTPTPMRAESEFVTILRRKGSEWVDRVFTAQAANGGIKESPSASEATTQVWTTAQCLMGILSTQIDLEKYVPKIKAAFNFIHNMRRIDPTEGWNLYGDKSIYTVTEINSWVTLAHIKSLESETRIWDDSERQEILNRIVRDLAEIKQRQDAAGGWKPIKDDDPNFTRTYSTVMALWSLIEARKSPVVYQQISNQYDESIRKGVNWLLRTYKEGQGWIQNPNRVGQVGRFDGLTAQTLFVLSRAETMEICAYIKNEQICKNAKKDFIKNKQFATWSIEKDNSSVPDPDVRFPNTEFTAEGSTFLWFPWVLAELTQISVDKNMLPDERKAAAQLRLDILNSNAERLEHYVETANLMYLLGENLFCISFYVDHVQPNN
jgi:hypothetical protein